MKYRDFITVALVVPERFSFPDNWIYIHAPDVSVGRVQNFRSWSPYMVKPGRTCLGLEYLVNVGDALWEMNDDELVALGARELERIGLVDARQVEAGNVVRTPKAYPFYDGNYRANVDVMRKWIEANTPNVYPVGRNGMHRYNNQDHSMFTAMLSVANIDGADHDIWAVNVEQDTTRRARRPPPRAPAGPLRSSTDGHRDRRAHARYAGGAAICLSISSKAP